MSLIQEEVISFKNYGDIHKGRGGVIDRQILNSHLFLSMII